MRKLYHLFWSTMVLTILMPVLGNAQAKLVISQVYGGGGNSGATFTHDFIELFNSGDQPQNISGWSVQYASSSGSSWQVTTLEGTIQPGKYYLIQQAAGSGGTQALPTPDATGSIFMAASNGKVALVSNANPLTGSCPLSDVIDFVGYGTANCSETSPTAALANATAAIRNNGGCTDTDNNSLDFTIATPNPRNSLSPTFSCTIANPISATGNANPNSLNAGGSTLLTIVVTPATQPASTGLNVQANLTAIGGSATQPFFDDGTNGDLIANDNIFSYNATIAANAAAGEKQLTATVTDAQSRIANTNIFLTVSNSTDPLPAKAPIVISQVYGGGGNTGATFNQDFIEIFNRGDAPVDLSKYSLQYTSATGTGNFGAGTNTFVALSGTVNPGQYFLVGLSTGTTGSALPTPDLTHPLNMAAGSGKIALVQGSALLGCNGSSNACSTEQLGRIVDLVGYGNANFYEGAGPAPMISATSAAFRQQGGCLDTDNNQTDFFADAPAPRNTASALNPCVVPKSLLVISQVYGGGGNSGATFNQDFVEIFNRGTAPADLANLSLQYTSATGTGNFGAGTNTFFSLSGTINPGQYFLVGLSVGNNGSPLPTPDLTGPINLAAAAGKIALVQGNDLLGCNGANNPCSLEQLGRIIDLAGYGNANFYEGAGPAPAISATSAAFRKQDGCQDTDNNQGDFFAAMPAPRNSATPLNECSKILTIVTNELPVGIALQPYQSNILVSGGEQPYQFSLFAGSLPNGILLGEDGSLSGIPLNEGNAIFTIKVTDAQNKERTREFNISISMTPVCNPSYTIAEVQGEGLTSPLVGNNVTISGIVTGKKGNGYFIQMEEGDGNPNTSDALFVFTSSTPPVFVEPGNELCVTGTVFEFVSSLDPGGRTLTQLTTTTAFVTAINRVLPAPVVLTATELTPNGGLDQLEKFENMRVTVPSLTVVAPTQGNINEIQASATSNGFFYSVITGTPRPFREPGIQEPLTAPVGAPATVERWDGNPELLGVASSAQPGNAPIDVAAGDLVLNMTGPLDFLRKYFVLNADGTGNPEVVIKNTGARALPAAEADELTVASYNLERFFDDINDPAIGEPIINPTAFENRLNKAALGIINVMRMPDVIGFQEIENLSTLQALANRVNQRAAEAGFDNPQYVAFLEEGNDQGGIDVGFIVKTTRVQVESVTQFGKNTTFTNPSTGNQDILNDRPPLALKAKFLNPTGCQPPVPFIVISNHLRSLNGNDDLTDGRVRTKRLEQAKFLGELINSFTAENPDANIISLGDYNAFEFNDGYVDIVGTVKGVPVDASLVVLPSPVVTSPSLINLVDGVSADNRYSYVFFGSAQHLDHIMVNPNMNRYLTKMVPVHFNADYPEIVRGDFSRPERISDHDPLVAYFKFPELENSFSCSITPIPGPGPNTNGGPNQIYIGYGPKSVTLQTNIVNGTPVSYDWAPSVGLSCTNCPAPVFTPTKPGLYDFSVTITNEDGCTTTCDVSICVLDIRVPGRNNNRVLLCHRPRRNPGGRTLQVKLDKIEVRLRNPDSRLGDCNNGSCAPTASPKIITSKGVEQNEAVETKKTVQNGNEVLSVRAMPNPTNSIFNFEIKSIINDPVHVRIIDISGRPLESRFNIQPNTNIRMGADLKDGIYFAEFNQKGNRVILKITKTK